MINSSSTIEALLPAKIARALRIGTALVLAASCAYTVQAQTSGKKLPGRAVKSPPTVSIDQLAQVSDVVAVGKVSETRSEWNEDKSRIQTRVTISVDQGIKGAPDGESITLLIPGGEVDGVGEIYTHTVQFRQDEDVLVFASMDTQGNLRVASGPQGKYLIQKDAKTGKRMIPSLGTLDEVRAKIQNSAKTQNTESKRN